MNQNVIIIEALDYPYFVRTSIKSMASRKIIAVVEDNKDNRLLMRALLGESYRILEYETAYQALESFKIRVPDLVILDISLPGMDGVELLTRLRAIDKLKHLPAIAITAHAMWGDREYFMSAGFDDYVAKPIVDEEQLLSTVERLLAAHSNRKPNK